MSTELFLDIEVEDEAHRSQKLAAAKKKLRSFRSLRSSDSSGPSSSSSRSPLPSPTSSPAPLPLTTDIAGNFHAPPRSPSKAKTKDGMEKPAPHKLRKSRSKGSMNAHRRQNSSISGAHVFGRVGSGLFDTEDLEPRPMRAELPRDSLLPHEIFTTPATPLMDPPTTAPFSPVEADEDRVAVKARLTTFSFGAKPAAKSFQPNSPVRNQPLLPSQLLMGDGSPSPNSSPIKQSQRLFTPSSRPPSLLLTRPTPLPFGTPPSTGPAPRASLESPQTPPTPARTKRHSHTRSNSISLPNLKLASRPTSLGFPSSPSFPSSPASPAGSARLNAPVHAGKLKFEPSGRGAEAEMEKEEYRRKALEKLTGTPSPVLNDCTSEEIALPDLDDEETSSIASSSRPFSGSGSFSFGRPSSSSSVPSSLSWSTSEDSPPLDRWSGDFNEQYETKTEGLGIGFTFGNSESGSFSLKALPTSAAPETGLGPGLPSVVPKRPGLNRNLSVLAEVEEPEDGEVEGASDDLNEVVDSPVTLSIPESPLPVDVNEEDQDDSAHYPTYTAPTPSGLRELHLVSSVSSTPSSVPRSAPPAYSTPTGSGSPTKGYGAIGRGRPRPLSGIPSNVFGMSDSPSTSGSLIATPKSAGPSRRRAQTTGSRGSSISYKKNDDSAGSSRDWSVSDAAKEPFSPSIGLDELASPPMFSPRFTGWGNMPRPGISRPCPRPKSLAGLGADHRGSGRVLGEVEEEEEEILTASTHVESGFMGYKFGGPIGMEETSSEGRSSTERSRDSLHGGFAWRDPQLELELERDALREDVEMWKARYAGLEDKLEGERKENGILRERLKKLSDRLASMFSYPNAKDSKNETLIADLREQLFRATSQLDLERTSKAQALRHISELEDRLASAPNRAALEISPQRDTTLFQSHIVPPTPCSPFPGDSALSCTSASPIASPDPGARMKSWGFPRGPVNPSSNRSHRDSFFGLSQVLRRDSTEPPIPGRGVDLPPFLLTPESAPRESPSIRTTPRSISEPLPSTSPAEENVRSISLTSSATSAMSFLAGYLPKTSPTKTEATVRPKVSRTSSQFSEEGQGGESVVYQRASLDLRKACKCCVGEVIVL